MVTLWTFLCNDDTDGKAKGDRKGGTGGVGTGSAATPLLHPMALLNLSELLADIPKKKVEEDDHGRWYGWRAMLEKYPDRIDCLGKTL